MMVSEMLDGTVVVLLVVALVYGFRLNSKINLIQDSKKELSKLFRSFDQTILKAQESIETLKLASEEMSGELQKKLDKAALLADDLLFMSEKATEVSTKLARLLEEAKTMPQARMGNTMGGMAAPRENSGPLSPEQVRKLRQKNRVDNLVSRSAEDELPVLDLAKEGREEKAKNLENILNQIAEKKEAKDRRERAVVNDNRTARGAAPAAGGKPRSVVKTLKDLGFGD